MSSGPSQAQIARDTLITLCISALGGFIADLAGLPAGWLMGGAIGVAVAGLLGVRVTMPDWLRDVTFVLTGLSMGATVARDSLLLLAQWPVTLAALALELVLIVAGTGYMLRRLFGVDRGTAYLSSFPGHLSFVMSIAAAGVGDSRQIVIIQVIRILMLTTVVPFGALFLPVGHYAPMAGLPDIGWLTLGVVGAVCTAVGFFFTRWRVPAGYVLGAMAVAMTAKFTGNFEGALPAPVLVVTFVLVGGLIGSRFSGITLGEFGRAAVGGLIATLMTVALVTIVALGASQLVDMPFGQIWLGLSPGGLEAMGALGIALGFDTAFIAAHHVARLLMLTVAVPAVVLLIRERPPKEKT